MMELMGLKPNHLHERAPITVDQNVVTKGINNVSVDSERGTVGGELGDKFAQSYVGADIAMDTVRKAIGNTPISDGIVNEIVFNYHDGTGEFTLSYSFNEDIVYSGITIEKGSVHTTTNAEYNGLNGQGHELIIGDIKTGGNTNDEYENPDNRNKGIVKLFKSINIPLDGNPEFVEYFRKNIRPILRRMKQEFPEYKINFTDKPMTELLENDFITVGNILIEGYIDSLKHLNKLKASIEFHKKDGNMVTVLKQQMKDSQEELLKLIRPKVKKVFGKMESTLPDGDVIDFVVYLGDFLEGLKKDYPQYRISFDGGVLKEEDVIDVEIKDTHTNMSIIFNKELDSIFIGRSYPCTVGVGGVVSENVINIIDAKSNYINKGSNTNRGTDKGNNKKDEEGLERYKLPEFNELQDDKGKTFKVKMSIDIDPMIYLSQSNEHSNKFKKHSDMWSYQVKMLDNGFEVVGYDSKRGEKQNFPNDSKLRMLFSRGIKEVVFGKSYQMSVLQNGDKIGSLNVTIGEIKRKTSI